MSLILSIYLFEGYLTFKISYSKDQYLQDKEQIYENQTGNKWDKRSKLEIYDQLKKNDSKIVLNIVPSYHLSKKNYSIFPLSGISNSNTILCNENGYYATYRSDRFGFNNPDNEWDNQEIEYLLVGDSFTQGACVKRPNDIGSVLRNLSKKSVLNLGYGGNGPLIEFATLREYMETNVKKVLWLFYEDNDFQDLYKELNNKILMYYYNVSFFTQNLKLKQNKIDELAFKIIEDRKKLEEKKRNNIDNFRYKLIKFIKIFNTRNLIFPPPIPEIKFKKILKLSKELVTTNNSKLYFIYLPGYPRYISKPNIAKYNLVKNIVTELQIPFIDIHKEVFEQEQNPLNLFPFKMRGHYNNEGYKKVAETIYKFTKN